MALVADSPSGLGTPSKDGTIGFLRLGVYPDLHIEPVWWNSSARGGQGAWIGKPLDIISGEPTNFMFTGSPEWGYLNSAVTVPTGYHIHGAIDFAGPFLEAGMKLQMTIIGRARGNGTYATEHTPVFFEYGENSNNKLSLNNDSGVVPFANLQNGFNTVTTQDQTLPANADTVLFTLDFLSDTSGFPVTPAVTDKVVLLHAAFDRPVRLGKVPISIAETAPYASKTATSLVSCERTQGYSLNNLFVPAGTKVYMGRKAAFPPSGYNPNGLPTLTGNGAGPGLGNIGNGPIYNSGIAQNTNYQYVRVGWQDVSFFRSFSSGETDFSRPLIPFGSSKNWSPRKILYVTIYGRVAGVPQGTAVPQINVADFAVRSRWTS